MEIVLAFCAAISVLLLYEAFTGGVSWVWYRLRPRSGIERLAEMEGWAPKKEELSFLSRLLGKSLASSLSALGAIIGNPAQDEKRLLQAGYPTPFSSLGDFYAWKALMAFLLFAPLALAGALLHLPFLFPIAFAAGAFGLFWPDLAVRRAIKARRDEFIAEMGHKLMVLGMFLQTGVSEEEAFELLAQRPGGEFTRCIAQAVADYNTGIPLIQALKNRLPEYPLPEFSDLIRKIQSAREEGAPLARALYNRGLSLQRHLSNTVLGRGTTSLTFMVLTMALSFLAILAAIGAPLVYFIITQGLL